MTEKNREALGRPLTSIKGFIDRIEKIVSSEKSNSHEFYFRGHSKKSYKITPSIFREDQLKKAEHLLFREIITTNPGDFQNDTSTLDKLARMQHHSCPTRLLDISSNPLVALYFACKSHQDETGEVIAFRVDKSHIKFYDSDTISLIANIARLSDDDKFNLNELIKDSKSDDNSLNRSETGKRLLHFIREEKPYFEANIKKEDICKAIIVRSKLNSKRIFAQSGAFLIFGQIDAATISDVQGIHIERISIDSKSKRKIIHSLSSLGVNDGSMFLDIDNYASHFKKRINRKGFSENS